MDEDQLKHVFTVFDRDGDGTINTKELGVVMRSLGQDPSEEELERMIADVDADGSGEIEFDEFKELMDKRMRESEPEEELKEVFRMFDKKDKGWIDTDDLQTIFRSMGEEDITKEDCYTMIKAHSFLDNNNDPNEPRKGLLFEEFINLMMYR